MVNNLTTAAGVNEDEQEGIYSVLKEVEVVDAIVPVDGYDLLPGSKLMKNLGE